MKKIIRTDIGRYASLNIEDSIIKDSRVKDTATVNVKKDSNISLSMFHGGLSYIDHSNLNMVNVKCELFACQDAKIKTCGFSGITKIVDCEIAYCTLDDVDIFGMHCQYTVKPGKDIYVPTEFSDYEFNLKNEDLGIMFRNPSKVWIFHKMSLAEFLEKYWKKVVGVTSKF